MKKIILAIVVIGMMASCNEAPTKRVVAHRMYDDTITSRIIIVSREFRVGEVVTPISDSTKYRIIRECRR